ncbi:STAS domain-containing protein [Nonomuraea sp. NPDC049400]|uniref:STAS domain-containing protein n=1 Tax=Nonomuraea sp. NPDC049400 TaxID=3364352 RepID=UPI0037B80F46
MPLTARVTQDSDRCIVALDGELDICSAPCLLAAVDEALAGERRNLLVEATGLTFCDSHGLEALLQAQREVTDAGGTMELAHLHDRVRRLLELTGLTRAFTITPKRSKDP